MKVRDLMSSTVKALGPEASAKEAYDMMSTLGIRHVPVVDDDEELLGIVSDRDLLRNVLGRVGDLPLAEQRDLMDGIALRAIMTTVPDTVEPDEDIKVAADWLLEFKIGCLPVTEGSKLVGILTEADFVRQVAESL